MKNSKLVKLKASRAKEYKLNRQKRHEESLESNKAIKHAIDDLYELINDKEEFDSEKFYEQFDLLSQKLDFTEQFEKLENRIKENKPERINPQLFANIVKAIKENKPVPIKIDLDKLEKSIREVSKKIEKQTQSSKDPGDYIPVRRVVKVGNRLLFDDQPTSSRASGGSGVPLIQDDNGLTAVPVANSDGSPVGGSGGAATIADGDDATQGAKADAAATSDTGTFSLVALFKRLLSRLQDRPSEAAGRTYKTAMLSNQTADAALYTVTAGETLYITSVSFSAFNTSTAAVGIILIKDGGTGGTSKIPILMTPAGVAAQFAASASVQNAITFAEPLEFSSDVFMDITSGSVTYSIMMVGYEE